MAALDNVAMALRNQWSRELNDIADVNHGILSVLAALDNLYGVRERFVRSSDLSGEKIQIDFRSSLPTVTGVNARTESTLSNLEIAAQTNFAAFAGTMDYSFYHMREDVKKSYLSAYESDPKSVMPYLMKVAKAMRDATWAKVHEDMVATDGIAPSYAAVSNGEPAENEIMDFSYPLQSGYLNNDASGAGTYNYLGVDMNTAPYTNMKATNVGNTTTGFGTATWAAIRRNLVMPVRHNQGNPDLIICDSDVYDKLIQDAESKVELVNDNRIKNGSNFVQVGEFYVMVDPRLDTLKSTAGNGELWCVQSDTFQFALNEKMMSLDFFQHPSAPSLLTALGYFECALACHNPRHSARAFDITV